MNHQVWQYRGGIKSRQACPGEPTNAGHADNVIRCKAGEVWGLSVIPPRCPVEGGSAPLCHITLGLLMQVITNPTSWSVCQNVLHKGPASNGGHCLSRELEATRVSLSGLQRSPRNACPAIGWIREGTHIMAIIQRSFGPKVPEEDTKTCSHGRRSREGPFGARGGRG